MPGDEAAERPRILVIKHGALGDFVLALGPFAAIRAHHLGAHIVLLTTPPFAELGRACGCFDEIWLDERAPLWRLDKVLALRARLRGGNFARVYDLQTSKRSSAYFRFFAAPKPEWSGIAPGCSLRHDNPDRVRLHTVPRQQEQLKLAGIDFVPPPDVSFLQSDVSRFELPEHYALLVSGGSAHRPAKRWPAIAFAELANRITSGGVTPVLLGAAAERETLHAVASAAPAARDLCGQTSFADLASLARHARYAIGNDTGPMHIITAAGCRSLVLFSADSDPKLCAPVGRDVTILRRDPLSALTVADVEAALVG